MKKFAFAFIVAIPLAIVFAVPLTACPQNKGGGVSTKDPQTDDQKTLYALGLVIGRNVTPFHLTQEELGYVLSGFQDQVLGNKPKVELQQWGPKISQLAQARQSVASEAEKKKGQEYADKMAKEPGAQKLDDGVIVIGEKEGTGEQPTSADRVKVNYRGTLQDGTEFDSSYKRGQPAEFPLGGVIKCWTEGLQKMKVGGKAKLICPSAAAYGDRGTGQIPGGATLTFEVELLEVQHGAAQPQMPPGMMPPGHPTIPPQPQAKPDAKTPAPKK